jgi:hypothetical protein
MNIESLATSFNGSEYPFDVLPSVAALAKEEGVVIVFGASDDLMEFRGAIYDELGAYNGTTALVDAKGLLSRDEDDEDEEIADYVSRKRSAKSIEALWRKEGDYSWTFATDIPHATFNIVEDGELYCRGIVFSLKELGANA